MQSGWLRASERKLDARKSTLLEPVLSLAQARRGAAPRGPASPRSPCRCTTRATRTGRARGIRVTLAAPGGDQPVWAFGETRPRGRASVTVARSRRHGRPGWSCRWSPGIDVPTALPPCPGLRGEPCRAYQPVVNRAG